MLSQCVQAPPCCQQRCSECSAITHARFYLSRRSGYSLAPAAAYQTHEESARAQRHAPVRSVSTRRRTRATRRSQTASNAASVTRRTRASQHHLKPAPPLPPTGSAASTRTVVSSDPLRTLHTASSHTTLIGSNRDCLCVNENHNITHRHTRSHTSKQARPSPYLFANRRRQ
jgi:hypothetical protein